MAPVPTIAIFFTWVRSELKRGLSLFLAFSVFGFL
jgi:hypothetical protein